MKIEALTEITPIVVEAFARLMPQHSASSRLPTAEQLEAIRGFKLPPGSPMAFVFTPLRARRGR